MNKALPWIGKGFDDMLQEWGMGGDYSSDQAITDLITSPLAKALGTAAVNGLYSGDNIRIQNLDGTMTSVLHTKQHLKIWNGIPKVPSMNHLYEYTERNDYGSSRGSAGFVEGGAPKGSISRWTRKNASITWAGTRGGISHPEMLVGRHGGAQVNPEEEENLNRTMELLTKLERMTLFNNALVLSDAGDTVNFNGFIAQMTAALPERIIDMKGAALAPGDLEDQLYKIFQEGKLADFSLLNMYLDGTTSADFAKQYYATVRSDARTAGNGPEFVFGTPMKGYDSSFGYLPFEKSVFMDETDGGRPLLAARTPAEVADSGAPVATIAPTMAAGANANSKFYADDAGAYYYVVAAVSDAGESLGTVSASAVTTAAGDRVTVTITKVTGAARYRVYRGLLSDGTDAQYVGEVVQPAGSTTTFLDDNARRPGTKWATVMHNDPADLAAPMMTPLVRWPLAVVSTTVEFLYLIYLTLVVKSPKRQLVFKNIGRL